MPTLIFDIETVGENWSGLDETTKSVLTHWLDKTSRTTEEKELMLKDIKSGLGFSPLTGFVVAIGLYDLERRQGVVYYTGSGEEIDEEIDGYVYKQRTESEMISEFWDGAKHYDTFVTFNGRSFDVPFLLHRSVVHSVKPTKNLMEGRYPNQQKSCRHVDLQDELTFFGAMYRRPSLHLFCRAYGIDSPKAEVSGDDVAELFLGKKFRDIALYNARDVVATTALYEKWHDYLRFDTEEKIDF
ncbi:MAG: ribonuclease H-like domain-containing protein [Candidatus Nomurabacteria bacterium]|nr:MAG: ribonuclease H-like domain-containing protein [Candidatus Nomurabacteria bacterium]